MKSKTIYVKKAVGLLCLAYVAVTAVGVLHTVFNALVLHMAAPEVIKTVYDYPAYAATVPFHPIYNLILWPLAALGYYKVVGLENPMGKPALFLGLLWCLAAIGIDTVGWVLIPHPFSMSWQEFFLDYQPWITLIYLTIFLSPFIGAYFYQKQLTTQKGDA